MTSAAYERNRRLPKNRAVLAARAHGHFEAVPDRDIQEGRGGIGPVVDVVVEQALVAGAPAHQGDRVDVEREHESSALLRRLRVEHHGPSEAEIEILRADRILVEQEAEVGGGSMRGLDGAEYERGYRQARTASPDHLERRHGRRIGSALRNRRRQFDRKRLRRDCAPARRPKGRELRVAHDALIRGDQPRDFVVCEVAAVVVEPSRARLDAGTRSVEKRRRATRHPGAPSGWSTACLTMRKKGWDGDAGLDATDGS